MRTPIFATAALIVLAGAGVLPQRTGWTFEDTPAGRAPQGFLFPDARAGQGSRWQVARDGANGVLAYQADSRGGVALALASGASLAALSLSARVRFPEAPGAAGIVWRYRNLENYYGVELDLRAQGVRIYRVVAGTRTRLEDEDDLELDAAAWHTVKVEDAGAFIRVWIDGVPVADGPDRSRQGPGAIGVWTRGDTTAWFDEVHAEPLTQSRRNNRRN